MEVRPAEPDGADAAGLIRAYFVDIAGRWYGREATVAEIDRALADEPAADLRPPAGYLALAYLDLIPVGMGGLRFLDDGIAELTKVFTLPAVRGFGVGTQVLSHLEHVAETGGMTSIRLDTRSDLIEACRLYEDRGYRRLDAFCDSPYSDRWYQLSFRASPQ